MEGRKRLTEEEKKERKRERDRKWRKENSQRANENAKRWAKENPEKHNKACGKYLSNQKQRAIEYKGGKCSICGYSKCSGALEFHHINPQDKEVKYFHGRKLESIKAELDKCILVCANCHRELHYQK